MWLGEEITAKGVGNGISLLIMAGIVAGYLRRRIPRSRLRLSRRTTALDR